MRKMSVVEIRKEQINMLIFIDEICRNNGLKYYLAYGTLIGCVRHKGFIPWDDDIDIWMLRDDYEKFRSILKEKKNNRYHLDDCRDNNKYYFDYGKLIDSETYIEEKDIKVPSNGLFIDIFPLDFAYEIDKNKADILKMIKCKKMYYYSNISYSAFNKNNFIKRCFLKLFLFLYNIKFIFVNKNKMVCKSVNKYLSINSKHLGYLTRINNPYKKQIQQYNPKYFEEIEFREFENHYFMIPKNYDEILKMLYGDYMKLPPENERINHAIEAFYK